MPSQAMSNPLSPWARLRGLVTGLFCVLVLFGTLLLFNVLQCLTVLLLPISRQAVRRVNRWAADLFWSFCVSLGEWLYGADVVLSGDDLPPGERVILIANHQQMTDVPFLFFLARDHRRLGDLKWMLKSSVKYVPGVGWGLYFLDSFFVDRNWSADEARIKATFARIVQDAIPVWFIAFVEGTRLTTAKLAASQAYAQRQGRQPLQHLLLPRTKGFVASVAGLGDCVDAVYDVSIGYAAGVPTLWQYIKGFARRAHLHVRRYPIASLPRDAEALAEWLHARFVEKDQLMSVFLRTGRFDDTGEAPQELASPLER